MKNYTRKDNRTLEQVSKAVARMRKQVAKMVTAHENQSAKNFVIFYKWVYDLEELEYKPSTKFATIRDLELHLEDKGHNTKISYFRYGLAGTDLKDMMLMHFN